MNKMSSIIFFHPSSDLYGADKILVYVLKAYSSFTSKILILPSEGPLIDLVEKECPDVIIRVNTDMPLIARKNLTPSGMVTFFLKLISFKKEIRKFVQDNSVIYLNTLAVIPLLVYFNKSNKKIIHIHEILNNNNLLNRLINWFALKKADQLICVSNAVLNNMAQLNICKKKLKLVYNGIDMQTNVYKKSEFEVDKSKIYFALIGRIKPSHKGQALLVTAISKLPIEVLAKSHFYFVGSPVKGQEYMQTDLINQIKACHLDSYISIIPFIKNIECVYRNIDVSIVPSIFDDPFPTTVLESMSFGKPVLGTNVGGIPEMIEDCITGYLCKRDDSDDLAEKIIYMIEHSNELLILGDNAKLAYENKFTEEAFMIRYKQIVMNEL